MNNHSSTSSGDAHAQAHQDNITPAALLEQLVYVDTFMPEIDDPNHLDDRLTAELAAFVGDSFVFPDEEKPKLPKDEDDVDNHNKNAHKADSFNPHDINSLSLNSFSHLNNSFSGSGNANSAPDNTTMYPLAAGNITGADLLRSDFLAPLGLGSNKLNVSQASSQIQEQGTGAPAQILSSLPKVPVPPGAKSSLIAAGLSTTQIDALAALIAQHESSKTTPSASASTSTTSSLNHNQNFRASLLNPAGSSAASSSPALTTLQSSLLFNSSEEAGSSTSRNNSVSDIPRLPDIKVEPTGDPELDKRKRNTAASARFRIKKKLKEQQLERSVRELTELTMTLEKKIQTLEMENRLLRNLVVEKGEQRNNNELEMLKQRAKMASDADHGLGGPSLGHHR